MFLINGGLNTLWRYLYHGAKRNMTLSNGRIERFIGYYKYITNSNLHP